MRRNGQALAYVFSRMSPAGAPAAGERLTLRVD
jgi:hypothetical protein